MWNGREAYDLLTFSPSHVLTFFSLQERKTLKRNTVNQSAYGEDTQSPRLESVAKGN